MARKPDTYQAVASRFDKTLLAKVNRGGVQELDLDRLKPRTSQPRRYFGETELEALAESVKAEGVRNPLHVRRTGDDLFEVLAGERRYRAAKRVGLERVPVIVHDLSDAEADTLGVLDNLHRADLNPIEETEAVLTLAQAALGVDRDTTISKIRAAANIAKGRSAAEIGEGELAALHELFARAVGRLTVGSFAQARLPLLNLPQDVYNAVLQGRLSYTVATPLKSVKDDQSRGVLLEQAVTEGLTRTEVLRLIKEANSPPTSLRKLETRVKAARHYLGSEQVRRIPAAKRSEFTKLVDDFVCRAELIFGAETD